LLAYWFSRPVGFCQNSKIIALLGQVKGECSELDSLTGKKCGSMQAFECSISL
jgi:hypothetical protein